MSEPVISWLSKINEDSKYSQGNSLYAGTYRPENSVVVDIQLWNNRSGTEDVDDFEDFLLSIKFHHAEDAALLQYCTVLYDGTEELEMTIDGNRGEISLPEDIVISGKKNNGVSTENPDNYIQLQFVFDATEATLKENDLKSLFFEIQKK